MPKYAIGVDFGTESGRAVLVDITNGQEIATAVYAYANGVIDEVLPESNLRLEPDWALQDPEDYIRVFQNAIPAVLQQSGVNPADVIGIGIDFTACTMLPTLKDGTPLCVLPQYRNRPHAWVKLWKHHAAQPEANRLNEIATELGYSFLNRYGGKISSEWFFPKVWQILNEDPEIYFSAERFIEAADWVVWQLTGKETRNSCTAGYKAIWSKQEGFPPREFFRALDPRLENIVDEKMSRQIVSIGQCAGYLTEEAARWTGLKPGTAVAVANVDAHVSVPASTVTEEGKMVMIMGTSICHMVLSRSEHFVPGICGYVEDGIIPGFFGYEAGQSCVGDHFGWFVEQCVPEHYQQEARQQGVDIHALLEEKAVQLKPGESGLLALDWWNGNRSVLVDVDLTGMMLGMTLLTKPEEIYRALIEATAYGTRVIIETFVHHGVPVNELIATGGLPDRNKLLMQIYADVTGREIRVAAAHQTPALGSAMFGAVAAGKAAGGYDDIFEAAKHMAHLRDEVYRPIPEHQQVYDKLYQEYLILHDYFGRGANDVMKRLKALKASIRGKV
ncbi:ribulokinase [Anaerolinea sp.]|uniref:ribulokinase n=1 Tax=Anaerolinea sp. TaxID=1872519 RepID=UPI002ACEB0FB|nr:ribulokinase [Anaerolinea sp.]